ncbi:hypothetical protein L6452_35775 [Arctium lappa]|uniref:Uncharacterized protein n=1 Tax=Arctium lappa TaxID=4217 RepID=A0ACB8Y830_ARCLA|nr:hypothetical protein L6452_35775 [Arctium lappa]
MCQKFEESWLGRAIFTGGSPYAPVEYNGKVYISCHSNNAYIFPKFGLGLIIFSAIRVHDGMLLASSEALDEQAFGEKVFEKFRKWLISMHS